MTQKRSFWLSAKQTKKESVAMNEDMFTKIRHFQSCYQVFRHVTKKSRCTIPNVVCGQTCLQNRDFIVEELGGDPCPVPPCPPSAMRLTTFYI